MKRFFKIYYNLYVRHKAYKKRNSYSQWGEDQIIKDFFKEKKTGFYVDIGCFHPIMYSNTCLLFNNGWNGINIDLNRTSIDLFEIMRPTDYNFCEAISDKAEEKNLFFDHNFSPVNTIEQSFYKESDKKVAFKKLIKKKIITKKFDDVVKKIPKLPKINFLNIDCEGHDYNILSSIDLNRYSPELICIETHKTDNKEEIHNKDIIKLLNHYKYKIFKRCGPSTLFIK